MVNHLIEYVMIWIIIVLYFSTFQNRSESLQDYTNRRNLRHHETKPTLHINTEILGTRDLLTTNV